MAEFKAIKVATQEGLLPSSKSFLALTTVLLLYLFCEKKTQNHYPLLSELSTIHCGAQ